MNVYYYHKKIELINAEFVSILTKKLVFFRISFVKNIMVHDSPKTLSHLSAPDIHYYSCCKLCFSNQSRTKNNFFQLKLSLEYLWRDGSCYILKTHLYREI